MKRPLFWGLAAPLLLRRLVPTALIEPIGAVVARHPVLAAAILALAAALGGLMLAASGVVPIKASSGHWAITERFLQFSKRRSVSTHAIGITAPELNDPALVLRGAGHYERGCRPCHGAPGDERPRVPLAMTPRPPVLSMRVPRWRASELFYIVKHGIKFTGMPAWTTLQRDDEVWAVVAFLLRMPGMRYDEYEALVGAPSDGSLVQIAAASCVRCHGADGGSRGVGAFPILAAQRPEYLARALRAYAQGRRHSGIMGPIAAELTPATRAAVVEYYASRPPVQAAVPIDREAALRGRRIAADGIPEQDVPACMDCHGPGAEPRNPAYPHLAGQYPDYLAQQLRLLRERRRGGSEYVELMHSFVDRLTDAQVDDVAAYYGSERIAAAAYVSAGSDITNVEPLPSP